MSRMFKINCLCISMILLRKMIHVKLGKPPYKWKTYGKTLQIIDNLMLHPHKGYDTIIINEAHKYANISLFAELCKNENTCVLIGGHLNENTRKLIDIADLIENV